MKNNKNIYDLMVQTEEQLKKLLKGLPIDTKKGQVWNIEKSTRYTPTKTNKNQVNFIEDSIKHTWKWRMVDFTDLEFRQNS